MLNNLKNADLENSSFHDSTINTTVSKLRKILGEDEGPSGDFKTTYNWRKSIEINGIEIKFSVYEWKEYREFWEDEIIEWHIGGYNQSETELVRQELLKLI